MTKRRVVITGLGVICPVGNTVSESWASLTAGKSGIRPITRFDVSDLNTQIAGTVENFDPTTIMELRELRRVGDFIVYAIEAARQAIEDSGLDFSRDAILNKRTGVAIGSGIGGLPEIAQNEDVLIEKGPRKVYPFFIPSTIVNMASGQVAMRYQLYGPNIAIATACTSGTHSIGYGARTISYGDADVMVVGGSEATVCRLGIAGFAAARALSKRNDTPEQASRPWDRDRDGFIMGEGAGVLVLEELEHAKARGATIYGELAGFGMSDDAYHVTSPAPEGKGAALCIQNTLEDAGCALEDIDYINAHGTSTKANDINETHAFKSVFGEHAKHLAISSTKSMTGHLLGAAGAIEAVFSTLALHHQVVPPTINLDNPDDGCDLDYVPHTARKMTVNTTLSTSFGFGGTNGALIFKRYR